MEKFIKFSMPAAFVIFGVLCIALTYSSENKAFVIMGIACIAAAVFMIAVEIRDIKVRKLYEQDPEEYERRYGGDDEEELTEEEKELEKIEKYDVDSGLEYCAHCGNYSVKDGRCEVCGEKVTE